MWPLPFSKKEPQLGVSGQEQELGVLGGSEWPEWEQELGGRSRQENRFQLSLSRTQSKVVLVQRLVGHSSG